MSDWIINPVVSVNIRAFGGLGVGTDDTAALQAAIAAAGPQGEVVLPPGNYGIQGGVITLTNVSLRGVGGVLSSSSGAQLSRLSSGPLLTINGSSNIDNLLLWDADTSGTRTGAAILLNAVTIGGGAITSLANLVTRAGYCRISNVRISSSAANGTWERCVALDGSLVQIVGSWGVRDIEFRACYFFGARTAGDTIDIKSGTHIVFDGCVHDPAPTAITQGILVDVNSTNVSFTGLDLIGNFDSHGQYVTLVGGNVSGNITIEADAVRNLVVTGQASGTYVNASTSSAILLPDIGVGGVYLPVPAAGGGVKVLAGGGGGTGILQASGTAVTVGSANAVDVVVVANGATVGTFSQSTQGLTVAGAVTATGGFSGGYRAAADVTGSRALNTNYTVPAGRRRHVIVSVVCNATVANAATVGAKYTASGVNFNNSDDVGVPAGAVVGGIFEIHVMCDPGSTYAINSAVGGSSTVTLKRWIEIDE